jgi:hypothetical protein
MHKSDVETLKQYVDLLPPYLTRRFISAEQDAVIVSGRVPDSDASQLLPIVDRADQQLNSIRAKYPEYKISVTGLSVISARNSANMIDKLSRGLTIEIVFVAAFIGLAFWSPLVMLISILPGLFPIVLAGSVLLVMGQGLQFASVIALTVYRPWAERNYSLPQSPPDRRHRSGPGGGGRACDCSGRPAIDPYVGSAGLRAGHDGSLKPAFAAAIRLAQRICDGGRAHRRLVHVAADCHIPQQDCAPAVTAVAAAVFGRIGAKAASCA